MSFKLIDCNKNKQTEPMIWIDNIIGIVCNLYNVNKLQAISCLNNLYWFCISFKDVFDSSILNRMPLVVGGCIPKGWKFKIKQTYNSKGKTVDCF